MNKHAIKSGAMIGLISIILSLLLYIVDSTLFASFWVGILIFIAIIGLVCYFGIQHRNEEGGFMAFGPAWMYSMQTFVVAGLIGTVFRIALFNVIDPGLAEVVTDAAVENTISMLEGFNTPDEVIEESIEKTREQTMDGFTVLGNIKAFGIGILIYAVISLITGLIIRRNEPENL